MVTASGYLVWVLKAVEKATKQLTRIVLSKKSLFLGFFNTRTESAVCKSGVSDE